MKRLAFCSALLFVLAVSIPINGQNENTLSDFSVTLTRVGCLGECPDYEVTILGNGSVRYEGHGYVRVQGVRERTIPIEEVKRLAKKLQNAQFFDWKEKDEVCVDLPEVHITAAVGKRRKHVVEGCNRPGKVLALAKQIDEISGANRWVH